MHNSITPAYTPGKDGLRPPPTYSSLKDHVSGQHPDAASPPEYRTESEMIRFNQQRAYLNSTATTSPPAPSIETLWVPRPARTENIFEYLTQSNKIIVQQNFARLPQGR
jgi:hypothetical protein